VCLAGQRAFLYDYGDDWRFRIELVGTGLVQPGANYPRIVGEAGKAPTQYPGNPPIFDGVRS